MTSLQHGGLDLCHKPHLPEPHPQFGKFYFFICNSLAALVVILLCSETISSLAILVSLEVTIWVA